MKKIAFLASIYAFSILSVAAFAEPTPVEVDITCPSANTLAAGAKHTVNGWGYEASSSFQKNIFSIQPLQKIFLRTLALIRILVLAMMVHEAL